MAYKMSERRELGETLERAEAKIWSCGCPYLAFSEETGYIGEIHKISPRLYSSPGLLSEAVSFVHIQVDESLSENQNPKAKNEPEEFITVFKKSVNEISEFFNQQSSQGIKFDAKLYSFFLSQGVL